MCNLAKSESNNKSLWVSDFFTPSVSLLVRSLACISFHFGCAWRITRARLMLLFCSYFQPSLLLQLIHGEKHSSHSIELCRLEWVGIGYGKMCVRECKNISMRKCCRLNGGVPEHGETCRLTHSNRWTK